MQYHIRKGVFGAFLKTTLTNFFKSLKSTYGRKVCISYKITYQHSQVCWYVVINLLTTLK